MDTTLGSPPGGGGSSGSEPLEAVKQQGQQAVEKTRQLAGQAVDQARTRVVSELSGRKEAAAGSLGAFAQALRQTGEQLREQDQSLVSQCANQTADLVEGVAGYLREKELGDVVSEVERFARREPVLFLGGAFALGFALARFLKSSSAPRAGDGSAPAGYGGGEAYAPLANPHPANILSPEGQSETPGDGRILRTPKPAPAEQGQAETAETGAYGVTSYAGGAVDAEHGALDDAEESEPLARSQS